MKFGTLEYVIIGAVLVLAVLLYLNRNCQSCKNRLNAISGAWPGAGPGVMERQGNNTSTVPAE